MTTTSAHPGDDDRSSRLRRLFRPDSGRCLDVAVDHGADVIKADPTDDPADYHHVVTTASGLPVLVRGGGRVGDEELLRRTAGVLAQGAAGIVYGRNIIQHERPAAIVRGLMAMLHTGADVETALALVREG